MPDFAKKFYVCGLGGVPALVAVRAAFVMNHGVFMAVSFAR